MCAYLVRKHHKHSSGARDVVQQPFPVAKSVFGPHNDLILPSSFCSASEAYTTHIQLRVLCQDAHGLWTDIAGHDDLESFP